VSARAQAFVCSGAPSAVGRTELGVSGRLPVIGFDEVEPAAPPGLSAIRQQLKLSWTEAVRRLGAPLRRLHVRPRRQILIVRTVQLASLAANPQGVSGAGPRELAAGDDRKSREREAQPAAFAARSRRQHVGQARRAPDGRGSLMRGVPYLGAGSATGMRGAACRASVPERAPAGQAHHVGTPIALEGT
jgi:hypothetical protein